tara:strand:+ start:245 stop:433 length:189 start_codon:yes stop_codon:yes gene_type:complete
MVDKQFREPYKSNTEALKKTIEVQKQSIALLTTQLHNEKLKNANLDNLARVRSNSGNKTVED